MNLDVSSKPAPSPARFATVGSQWYAIMLAVMAVTLILSNIGASKGVVFGPIVTDGGFFLFPLAYIVGDVISEVYGMKASRRAIITSFVLSAFTVFCFWVIINLPAAEWYEGQEALAATLGAVPLIVVGSLLGFLAGQLANAAVMVSLKKRQGERGLFLRIVGSTGVGEFIDTLIFCTIAAQVIGIGDLPTFINYVVVGFFYKTAVEVLFSPVTMWIIGLVKKAEPSY